MRFNPVKKVWPFTKSGEARRVQARGTEAEQQVSCPMRQPGYRTNNRLFRPVHRRRCCCLRRWCFGWDLCCYFQALCCRWRCFQGWYCFGGLDQYCHCCWCCWNPRLRAGEEVADRWNHNIHLRGSVVLWGKSDGYRDYPHTDCLGTLGLQCK